MAPFTFVDLFAGIGGFHAALSALGGECVYAVESDPSAAAIYERNWGMNPLGDIQLDASESRVVVPAHDVLTAGFPCQPFSKSGAQRGMDETRGTLYWNLLRTIQACQPKLVLLENVRNLRGPRHMHEWDVIIETLRDEGYRVSEEAAFFSPHLLPRSLGGRPQNRERVFIAATKSGSKRHSDLTAAPPVTNRPVGNWSPDRWTLATGIPLLPDSRALGNQLTDQEVFWIDAWDDFVSTMRKARPGERLPGFPIWAETWGLDPSAVIQSDDPGWKQGIILKNIAYYEQSPKVIDRWATKWGLFTEAFPASRRKLEWQAQTQGSMWDGLIHLRPSGLRVKPPNYLPALVAMTQTSVIGPKRRRLRPREAARLQGLPDGFNFDGQSDSQTFRQLGNGVSVGAVWHVLKQVVQRDDDLLRRSAPGLLRTIRDAPPSPDPVLREMFKRSGSSG